MKKMLLSIALTVLIACNGIQAFASDVSRFELLAMMPSEPVFKFGNSKEPLQVAAWQRCQSSNYIVNCDSTSTYCCYRNDGGSPYCCSPYQGCGNGSGVCGGGSSRPD